jgi:nitroreductase
MERAEHSGAHLGRERLSLFDSAMAAQNILLAAHAMGLGSCVVASFHASAVSQLLRLPTNVEPVLLVAVGHADHHPDAPLRLRKEVVSHETYEG